MAITGGGEGVTYDLRMTTGGASWDRAPCYETKLFFFFFPLIRKKGGMVDTL